MDWQRVFETALGGGGASTIIALITTYYLKKGQLKLQEVKLEENSKAREFDEDLTYSERVVIPMMRTLQRDMKLLRVEFEKLHKDHLDCRVENTRLSSENLERKKENDRLSEEIKELRKAIIKT